MTLRKQRSSWTPWASAFLALAVVLFAADQALAVRIYSNQSPGDPTAPALNPKAVSKSGVAAPAGSFWSEVQNDAGNLTESNTVAGFSGHKTTTTTGEFRLADDFTVPAGQMWTIDSVCVYGYQTGFAGFPASPISAGNLQIWNGRPGDVGSAVVFGDTTTNRLLSSTGMGLFRIFNSTVPPPGSAPGTTRRIYEHDLSAGSTVLGPGTYWIDFQVNPVTTSAAHFVPSATIEGARGLPGMNGRQFISTGWQDMIDAGNPTTAPDVLQDLPFILKGTIVPEPAALATMLLALGGLLAFRRR
jgi:hypothetical protein